MNGRQRDAVKDLRQPHAERKTGADEDGLTRDMQLLHQAIGRLDRTLHDSEQNARASDGMPEIGVFDNLAIVKVGHRIEMM